MKIIYLFILILLVGCSTKEIIYHNETTFQNQTIMKETIIHRENITLICEKSDCICNDNPKCKTDIKTIITDDCTKKLNLCNLGKDFLNDELFDCLNTNNSQYNENVTSDLKLCEKERKVLEDKINNISNIV